MINSHTGFQPLREVWLGGVYPSSFYSHYDNKTQDVFSKITEITQNDLNNIEKKLIDLGVNVRRPTFTCVNDFLDESDNLIKPPICPRDWAITIGNALYVLPQYYTGVEPYQDSIDEYRLSGQNVIILDRSKPESMCYLNPPSVVRVGRDLFIDYSNNISDFEKGMFETNIKNFSKTYRVHVTHTGEHNDGIFCPIANGNIFSTHYQTVYDNTFPGWDVFFLTDTTKQNRRNSRWWLPGFHYPHINPTVTSVAESWLGDSRETVFEVNMLVVDEKNVICIAEDDAACQKMESLGITPHVVDFKSRGFWDGGIHCLTLDIHREGECLDYWPNRGPNGIYRY